MIPVVRSVTWGEKKKMLLKSTKARCPACWLKLCIKRYILMPEVLKIRLNKLLPDFMIDPIINSNRNKNKGPHVSKIHLRNFNSFLVINEDFFSKKILRVIIA